MFQLLHWIIYSSSSTSSASTGPTDVHFNSWLFRWLRMQSRQATVRLIGSGCLFSLFTSFVWFQAHLIFCFWLHLNFFFFFWESVRAKQMQTRLPGNSERCGSATTWAGMMMACFLWIQQSREKESDMKKNEGLIANWRKQEEVRVARWESVRLFGWQ